MLVHGTVMIDFDNGWMYLVFMYFRWQEIISSTYTFDVTIYGSMKIGKKKGFQTMPVKAYLSMMRQYMFLCGS